MELKGKLIATQRLEQTINPRLYQAMDLLYMPLLDLQQYLKQELLVNPFLELVESVDESDEESSIEEEAEETEEDEIDWEKVLMDGFDAEYVGEEKDTREPYERVPVTRITLYDHLLRQLSFLKLTERERAIGEEIIGNINEDGYLTCDLSDITKALAEELKGVNDEEVEAVLVKVQTFDPPGVAARSIQECLLIQLEDKGQKDSLPYRIVKDFFPQLTQHKWSEIARAIGVNQKEVQDQADFIAGLEPKPGRRFSEQPDNYVTPDLIVERVDGEYIVSLNDSNVPRLRKSSMYWQLAQDKKKFKGETKKFILEKLSNASWLIQAIEQRRQTMLKVMNFIIERQLDFFERGISYLRPLTLREVAEVIDMHESTVSRVTNAKYCQTPRGVFPLKFFFSSGLDTEDGDEVSARGIRDQIAKLISNEDTSKPLTDQAIVNILNEEGIRIARRTVAKYRDQLGILPARLRKRV
ncbi:MAG: RNA polymerase factor sigma-54 [Candidatus Glassbacteria bacterium]